MIVCLGFGSSHRRGAAGWTDRARVRWVLDTCQPDRTVDGASPAGGADELFNTEARAHFTERGLDPDERALRCPVDTSLDGAWPRAGLRRNERQYRTWRPQLAAGFVSGKAGTPLSSGSAHMARVCLRGLEDVPPCAVVVFREDGVEPYRDVAVAYQQIRRLYAATKDERLVEPGRGLGLLAKGAARREEVLSALGFAADGSRWAPWIMAVEATVRRA